jgi:hypothetical protein
MSDMWKKVGFGKLPENKNGKVANTEEEESPEEVERKRKSYLKYNRNTGKTEKAEIPLWDRQDFKK